MQKFVDRAVSSDCSTRNPWWIGLIVLIAGTTLALYDPGTGAAMKQGRTGVPARAPRMPATMIVCLDGGSTKFVDETQPADCEVAGYEGERGHKWVRIPVNGIRWNEWGVGNTPSTGGKDPRNGAEVELFAYRRIRCGDGRTFYSRASTINLRSGRSTHLRLPICDDPAPQP
jgi:hypothetical protein